MSILINKKTRVICQGITGHQGSFHVARMKEYGTQIIAGVTPGKGGEVHQGIPVFDTVRAAHEELSADASIVFVPSKYAAEAIVEAAEAGIKLIVCITEGIPQHDMLRVNSVLRFYGAKLIGPNSPGIITPGESKIGIMPADIHIPGTIGIVSRSGTLTYEAVLQTSQMALGQTTCVGLGGDPIHGLDFITCLKMFEEDRKTKGIIMVGEIGGAEEEYAADFIKRSIRKPVVAYIAGLTAPKEKQMGHAGAIITKGRGAAKSKFSALEDAGVMVVRSCENMGQRMFEYFKG